MGLGVGFKRAPDVLQQQTVILVKDCLKKKQQQKRTRKIDVQVK